MTGLICRSREETVINADKRIVQYVCRYTNDPCDVSQFIPPGNQPLPVDLSGLPYTLEYSSEFVNIKPTSTASTMWEWTDNSQPVLDPISWRVINLTLRIKRYISDIAYNTFNYNCSQLEGKVNQWATFSTLGFGGIGCWLFTSATTEMLRNHNDQVMWQGELIFVFRDPDRTNVDGWQKILRQDGTWQKPRLRGISPDENMYSIGDFDYLFNDQLLP
jgi:hypothetical protein